MTAYRRRRVERMVQDSILQYQNTDCSRCHIAILCRCGGSSLAGSKQ